MQDVMGQLNTEHKGITAKGSALKGWCVCVFVGLPSSLLRLLLLASSWLPSGNICRMLGLIFPSNKYSDKETYLPSK